MLMDKWRYVWGFGDNMPSGIQAFKEDGTNVFDSSKVAAATFVQRFTWHSSNHVPLTNAPGYSVTIPIPWIRKNQHFALRLRATGNAMAQSILDYTYYGMAIINDGSITIKGNAAWVTWYYKTNYYIDIIRFA